jgi:hypothetical protein
LAQPGKGLPDESSCVCQQRRPAGHTGHFGAPPPSAWTPTVNGHKFTITRIGDDTDNKNWTVTLTSGT